MPSIHPHPVSSALGTAACRIAFDARRSGLRLRDTLPILEVALPLLEGSDTECILEKAEAATMREGCTVFQGAKSTAGFVVAPAGADLETATRELYRRMFAATRGLRLHRIWNYVPRINALERGLENYRHFCRGRSLAFEEQFGATFQRQLPAASAVSAEAGPLAIAFLAGEATPRHFENPKQIPAFEYPADYGPRPPSFSRATLVDGIAHPQLFISGTAAIRGHLTIAADDLAGQLACTLENLRVIVETAGVGPLDAARAWRRAFKVYVRHRREFPAVRQFLERHLLEPADNITYLQADLCRADLRVEIEAVLTRDS